MSSKEILISPKKVWHEKLFHFDKTINWRDVFTVGGILVSILLSLFNSNKINIQSKLISNAESNAQSASIASASAKVEINNIHKSYTIVQEDISAIQKAMTNFYSNLTDATYTKNDLDKKIKIGINPFRDEKNHLANLMCIELPRIPIKNSVQIYHNSGKKISGSQVFFNNIVCSLFDYSPMEHLQDLVDRLDIQFMPNFESKFEMLKLESYELKFEDSGHSFDLKKIEK